MLAKMRNDAETILERVTASAGAELPLPRALLVFAHPDDEVLAVGARLDRFRESRLLCVTDGAPRDGEDARLHGLRGVAEYRAVRRAELEAALRASSFPVDRSVPLRIRLADGLEEQLADKEAMQHLPALVRALIREIDAIEPEAVLTHPYEGGHPDHDSCAFAVHAAVRLSRHAPVVIEAPSYFAGPNGFTTGQFLPGTQSPVPPVRHELLPEEQMRKRERRACFVTQRELLDRFPLEYELYRVAPNYDFTQPPHAGELLYEGWGWGVRGAHFREFAAATLGELGLA